MAIGTIIIEKIKDHNNDNQSIAFYEISSSDFDINNFYMCIDKLNKTIGFFLEREFSRDPIRLISYNKNDRIGVLPGILTMVLSIVLRHALRVFNMDIFPESLSYST